MLGSTDSILSLDKQQANSLEFVATSPCLGSLQAIAVSARRNQWDKTSLIIFQMFPSNGVSEKFHEDKVEALCNFLSRHTARETLQLCSWAQIMLGRQPVAL